MAIQIFGTGKCFETKKAQRFFKERRVDFQFIDLKEKGFSRGELESVLNALAKEFPSKIQALDFMADSQSRDFTEFKYLDDTEKFEKLLEKEKGFLFFNPGSISIPKTTAGKTFGTIEVKKDNLVFRLKNLDGRILEELEFAR